MPDIFDKKTRSKIMSSIKSKNTKIELLLRKALWKEGLRYRLHYNINGSPDIVFVSRRVAIFVDGDFWHGYKWKELKPKLKNEFWVKKIKRNMQRDVEVDSILIKNGWRVLRVWEHEISEHLAMCVAKIRELLN